MNKEVELSIIISVKDAYQYFVKCIKSLYMIEDVNYEVIIINDGSTDSNVLEYLETFKNINVLHNETSIGFLLSTKIAAREAIGKYILHLNSDTEVIEPKSFRYMLDVFKNKKNIGVVGAKLLLGNDTIQHAGMSFKYDQMNYYHRYYGVDKNDPRVCVSETVDVVTGACFMTPAKLWKELDGWDEKYIPAYFEDTDYALRAKDKGYQTYYCADAILRHYQSKSYPAESIIKNFDKNHEIFKQKYIRNSKIVQYPKIAACYIVLNEEDYIEYSIKSIYDFVEKIIVVEGGTESMKKYCTEGGRSIDKTIDILKNISDPGNKITIVPPPKRLWKDKTEQRNAYCGLLDEMDYAFIVDGDEIWDKNNLKKIERLMFSRPDIPGIQFNFKDFYKDFEHLSKGVWEQFKGRISFINLNLTGNIKYDIHTLPITANGDNIPSLYCEDIFFFHYSYVRTDERMKQKINYYIETPSDYYDVV